MVVLTKVKTSGTVSDLSIAHQPCGCDAVEGYLLQSSLAGSWEERSQQALAIGMDAPKINKR